MIPSPNVRKIPGNVMPVAESDNGIKDPTKLSKLELLDLKKRVEQLLENKRQLNKLPDKGALLKTLHGKIEKEIARRSKLDEATALFSNLNIADSGAVGLTELEWKHGNMESELVPATEIEKDSDDEEEDVKILKIIARQAKNREKTSYEESITPINNNDISEAELVEIDLASSFDSLKPKLEKILAIKNQDFNEHVTIDPHASHLIEKAKLPPQSHREKFKPFKSTINNTHDPLKEMKRKQGSHWENTAATPPPIKSNGTQMISLLDSMEIQNNYIARLKNLQTEQANERLKAKNIRLLQRENPNLITDEKLKTSNLFTKYRNIPNIEGHSLAEENDSHELEEEEKSSVVNYTFST